MSKLVLDKPRRANRLKQWLLRHRIEQTGGPEAKEGQTEQHSWWQTCA